VRVSATVCDDGAARAAAGSCRARAPRNRAQPANTTRAPKCARRAIARARAERDPPHRPRARHSAWI